VEVTVELVDIAGVLQSDDRVGGELKDARLAAGHRRPAV
jgi:hypothetical protein